MREKRQYPDQKSEGNQTSDGEGNHVRSCACVCMKKTLKKKRGASQRGILLVFFLVSDLGLARSKRERGSTKFHNPSLRCFILTITISPAPLRKFHNPRFNLPTSPLSRNTQKRRPPRPQLLLLLCPPPRHPIPIHTQHNPRPHPTPTPRPPPNPRTQSPRLLPRRQRIPQRRTITPRTTIRLFIGVHRRRRRRGVA